MIKETGKTYVSAGSTDNTVNDGGPGWDESGTRSDGDKTSNDTRAETDSGPLAFKTIIQDTPCDTSDAGSQVGDYSSHDSTHVGSKSGTSVETEPTNPEEDSADDNVSNVVWAVVQFMSTVSATLAQHDGVCKSCATTRNVHRSSSEVAKLANVKSGKSGELTQQSRDHPSCRPIQKSSMSSMQ